MTTNPIFFWTTFAGLFLGSQFIPIVEVRKPNQEGSYAIYLWEVYLATSQPTTTGEGWGIILVAVVFHVAIVTSLALLATGIYRHLVGQSYQASSVLASPEPTRSEWESFLAGHGKD